MVFWECFFANLLSLLVFFLTFAAIGNKFGNK